MCRASHKQFWDKHEPISIQLDKISVNNLSLKIRIVMCVIKSARVRSSAKKCRRTNKLHRLCCAYSTFGFILFFASIIDIPIASTIHSPHGILLIFFHFTVKSRNRETTKLTCLPSRRRFDSSILMETVGKYDACIGCTQLDFGISLIAFSLLST